MSAREIGAILDGALREVRARKRWLANPEEFALEVIGRDALDEAARYGGSIAGIQDFPAEQTEYLAAFCDVRIPRVILSSGRGGTKTFLSALGIATLAYCVPSFTVTVLAGSFEQGRVLYGYHERFAASERFALGLEGEPTKTLTRFRGGGWVRVLTASEKQVKGPHPQMLVIEEACAADESILDLAMGQRAGSSLGLLRVSSTPDKLFHRFRTWWTEAEPTGWRTFSWGLRRFKADGSWEPTFPWWERAKIEDFLRTQDSNWIRIHVDGQFGSATGTVFRFEDVEAARIDDPLVRPAPQGMALDPLYEEEAVADNRIGVDWGFQNPTVLTVTRRLEIPDDARERLASVGVVPPPGDLFYVVHVEGWSQREETFLYDRIADCLSKWPGDVYLDASHVFQNQAVRRIATAARATAIPVAFGRDKMAMVGWANALFERGRVRIPRRFATTLEQLTAYSWEEGKEKPMKVNDDYVDSLMLSLWGHRRGRAGPSLLRRPGPGVEPGTRQLRPLRPPGT